MQNFILNTDSYKLSHFLGYPEGTEHVFSYAESRGGLYPATVFDGIQRYVTQLAKVRVSLEDVFEARQFADAHMVPFNFEGWLYIVAAYEGRIPVRIKAVKEGTLVPTSNVLVTVENTDPATAWLTSYIETDLLRAVWYPTTVATRVHYMKQAIKPWFDKTSDSGNMDFAILDFGARGVSSEETSVVGGMAFLKHFIGSDNLPAVVEANKLYRTPMSAFSVPATEHSIMTAYGKENEFASFKRILDRMLVENGIVSVVSDTWNIYDAAKMWTQLAHKVKEKNGTLVVRPDSGDFREVLPKVLSILREGFGATRNSKGYDVLNNVKVLQGDGMNENSIAEPFRIAAEMGISADSIMTGSGGGLLQANMDRDTCRFAFKASSVTINGRDKPIAKDPITDQGKRSKQGKLDLLYSPTRGYYTVNELMARNVNDESALDLVYENGVVKRIQTLDEIRAITAANI